MHRGITQSHRFRHHPFRRAAIGLLVAFTLVATACGSSDDNNSGSTSPPTTADAAAAARDASKAWSALAAAATNTDTPLRSRSLAAAEVAAMLPETETRLVEALERASRSLGASTPTSTIN